MRKTPLAHEIALILEGPGPRHVPRPRVSAPAHVPLTSLKVDCPGALALCLAGATARGGTGAIATAEGDVLLLSGEEPALPPDPLPPDAPQMDAPQMDRAIAGNSARAQDWAAFLPGIVPRILVAASAAPADTPILIDAAVPAAQRQALRLLLPGHPLRDLAPGAAVRVGRLYAAEVGTQAGCSLSRRAFDGLAALRAGHDPAGGAARVLLWSAGVPHRLRNATDLRRRLEERGFVTVRTDTLSLPDRIRALAGARDIVAPDADSFADSLLAPEGARVLALVPAGSALHPLSMTGALAGHEVTAVLGSAPYHRLRSRLWPGWRQPVFHVDPTLLMPFFGGKGQEPARPGPGGLLDLLDMASGEADVLTGAWAVHAEATPSGFEARRGRGRGAGGAAVAPVPCGFRAVAAVGVSGAGRA